MGGEASFVVVYFHLLLLLDGVCVVFTVEMIATACLLLIAVSWNDAIVTGSEQAFDWFQLLNLNF